MTQRWFYRFTATPTRLLVAVMALTSAAGMAMLAFRLYYGGTLGYLSLPWDLFLAWVPLPLAFAVARVVERYDRSLIRTLPLAMPLAFLWLLFFPNAPYLLTEFVHLRHHGEAALPDALASLGPRGAIPVWFDVVMISTFAWTGLLLGFVSLHVIHRAATRLAGALAGWTVVVAGLGLCAFGISLGRFQRWNSWDLFAQPVALLADVLDRALNPLTHLRTSAVTILFAAFLLLGYLSLLALARFSTLSDAK